MDDKTIYDVLNEQVAVAEEYARECAAHSQMISREVRRNMVFAVIVVVCTILILILNVARLVVG